MGSNSKTVRLRVTPEVARIVGKDAPRELQLQASRGALPLSGRELATVLLFLGHSSDAQIRSGALETCRGLPAASLQPVLDDPEVHPQLLDFIARQRLNDPAVMAPLLTNPAVAEATLAFVAGHGQAVVLSLLGGDEARLAASPAVVAALLGNPQTEPALRARLGRQEQEQEAGADGEGEGEAEELNLSKYQQALELGVAEKIKIAMSGDKEWRTIFLKDSNKLVSTAALKNPRITDGEVLTVAKNKSSNEELIRLITLNKEWVKNYEIKKALILHPKTPLPKALRYMNLLTEKDLKQLAKSRNVSQILVNNARRMLLAKERKGR